MTKPNEFMPQIVVDMFPAAVQVSGDALVLNMLRELMPLTTRAHSNELIVEKNSSGYAVKCLDASYPSPSADHAVQRVLTLLNELHIFDSEEVLHLHAGAYRTGETAVIVSGASGAGKSTLVASAIARHEYVTDECVDISRDLTVCGWRKPLSLRGSLLKAPPAQGSSHQSSIAIVVLDSQSDVGLHAIDPIDTLRSLVNESLDFGRRPGDLVWLGTLVASGSCFRIGRRPVEEMVAAIDDAVSVPIPASSGIREISIEPAELERPKPHYLWHRESEAIYLGDELVLFNRETKKLVTVAGATDEFTEGLNVGIDPDHLDPDSGEQSLLSELETHGLVVLI